MEGIIKKDEKNERSKRINKVLERKRWKFEGKSRMSEEGRREKQAKNWKQFSKWLKQRIKASWKNWRLSKRNRRKIGQKKKGEKQW